MKKGTKEKVSVKKSTLGNYIKCITYKRVRAHDAPFILDDPKNVAAVARDIKAFPDDAKEHFGVFLLDGANHVLGYHPVGTGSLDASLVYPREVFAPALRELGCNRVILIHNHPSGDSEPSHSDIKLTKELVRVGRMLGVHVIDHVILASGSEKFSSLAQDGFIVDDAHKDVKG